MGHSHRHPLCCTASRSAASRGVTLVEVLVVSAIIGVLAVLASVGYGRWVASSKMAEATNMVAGIKDAQENYYSQAGTYLDVSNSIAPGYLYPAKTPGPTKVAWGDKCDWCKNDWKRLGIKADKPMYFGYATVADGDACDPSCRGLSFTTGTTGGGGATKGGAIVWTKEAGGPIAKPWFVVAAYADTNGNGVYAKVLGMSFNSRLVIDGEGE
ncbi:MAG: prepilin-type N-terminal cleavage/methylation domain-containing protein [Deltaproteobacteria bacterium]|nr:prepilin-type N-terminal cleavage/methylation domain-containing protein [Deltaproteobacteria bacterium]